MPTFNPHNHELIEYLNKKITGNYDSVASSEINELNILHHEPHEFPGLVSIKSSHTWYLISPVEKLKGKLGRTKRSSKTGQWKITGNPIYVKDVFGNIIGSKKILVFQEKKTKQNKTNWTIHEFHSNIQHPNKDAFVLCKLMKKTRASPSDLVADDSPVVVRPILSLDPNTSHFQRQNNINIVVEHYDQDFFDGGENDISRIRNNMLDGDVFSNNLCFEDIGDIFDF